MGKKFKSLTLGRNEAIASAQMMFEYQGTAMAEIARIFGISERAVHKWKEAYGWKKKGSRVAEVQETTQKKFLDILSQRGMPPEKAIDLLIDGMNNPMQDQVITTDKKGKPVVLFEGTPDYKAREKYLKQYFSIAGAIGGNSKTMEINNNGEGSVNVQVNLPTKKGLDND